MPIQKKADPLTPIWIEGRKKLALSKYTSISLPEWAFSKEDSYLNAVQSIKRLGYNTALMGSFARSEESNSFTGSLQTGFKEIKEEGIGIGVKATFNIDLMTEILVLSPLNEDFREFIKSEIERFFEILPSFDFFVYESLALIFDEMGLNQDDEHLISEIASIEITLIEEIIQGRSGLVYIFPGEEPKGIISQEHSLKEIALEAGSKTWLTFSSRCGNPFLDHLKIHPFLLNRDSQELNGFQFASIVNIGGIQQGGGLWPSIALDIIRSIYPLIIDLQVVPIPCIHGLPKEGSFLEASLLIASNAAKGNSFPEKDLLIWLKKNHQDYDVEVVMQDLKEVRDLCLHLSMMKAFLGEKSRDAVSQDETKLLATSVLYRLRSLSKRVHLSKKEPSIHDYLQFFIRDAIRIVLHFIQSFNVTLQESFEQDPGKKGYWTEFSPGSGHGVRNLGKVTLSKHPLLDTNCQKMKAVYVDAGWDLES